MVRMLRKCFTYRLPAEGGKWRVGSCCQRRRQMSGWRRRAQCRLMRGSCRGAHSHAHTAPSRSPSGRRVMTLERTAKRSTCLASLLMCTRKGTTLGWRCIIRTTMLQGGGGGGGGGREGGGGGVQVWGGARNWQPCPQPSPQHGTCTALQPTTCSGQRTYASGPYIRPGSPPT